MIDKIVGKWSSIRKFRDFPKPTGSLALGWTRGLSRLNKYAAWARVMRFYDIYLMNVTRTVDFVTVAQRTMHIAQAHTLTKAHDELAYS